jgi:DNA repair protein RadC
MDRADDRGRSGSKALDDYRGRAPMGSSFDPFGKMVRPERAAINISDHHANLASSTAPHTADRDPVPLAARNDPRCRSLLAELLAITGAGDVASADALIDLHGSLASLLVADPHSIRAKANDRTAEVIDLCQRVHLHALRTDVEQRPVICNAAALIDYLHARCAAAAREHLIVIFLDAKNGVMHEMAWEGGIAEAQADPARIIRRALDVGAAGLVLAHNHPSGDPQPSKADIATTRQIAESGYRLGVFLHDHIILSRTGHASMRKLGLVPTAA